MEIGFEVTVPHPYNDTVENVSNALKAEGFGVLTQIDVRATIKEKLGEDFRSYAILGACNPSLAYRALSEDRVVGLWLPCNVTVEATDEDNSLVRIANPEVLMRVCTLEDNIILSEVAEEARIRLERVAQSLIE